MNNFSYLSKNQISMTHQQGLCKQRMIRLVDEYHYESDKHIKIDKYFTQLSNPLNFNKQLIIIQCNIANQQQSCYNRQSLIYQRFTQQTMNSQLLKHSHLMDQQKKIMHQIQQINKKLVTRSHQLNDTHVNNHLNQHSHDHQQKYFSQQCDQLFNDFNYPSNANRKDTFDESLFNSYNQMLLGNQFEKEIKNFNRFETNKLFQSSQSTSKQSVLNQQKQTNFNSKSKSNQFPLNKNSKISNSRTSLTKTLSQTTLNSTNQTLSNKYAQSRINELIQNKQNLLPASNISKQQCFIKQIKKKIRFQTQPDYPNNINQQDSFQTQKQLNKIRNYGDSSYQISKSQEKYKHHKNTLQCTFKPSILKKSNQIAQNLQPSFQRLTQDIGTSKSQSKQPYKAKQQLTQKKYSVKRLEQLSQPRKQKKLSENQEPKYDFHPTISKKSLLQMANCTMDVASRNNLWLQQRQAKVLKLKQEEEQKKLQKQRGSFAPKITPYKGESEVHLSRFTKQGISSYFQRVSMAKQKIQTVSKSKPQQKESIKQSNVTMKKKTYDEAVKELHKKILAMNI